MLRKSLLRATNTALKFNKANPVYATAKTSLFHTQSKCCAAVTADLVKKLRKMTDAPLGQCKNALEESSGDIEMAKEWLRKKGIQTAQKKSGREANQGLVCVRIAADGSMATAIELNSETDFVTRNEKFSELANQVADTSLDAAKQNADFAAYDLKQFKLPSGASIGEALTNLIGTIGENLVLRRWQSLAAPKDGIVVSYVHNEMGSNMGGIGTLVALRKLPNSTVEDLEDFARKIAMQITAMQPKFLNREDVPAAEIEKERSILREKELAQAKNPEKVDKIVDGRMNKFFQDVALKEQQWVFDTKTSVGKVLHECKVEVTGFVRLKCGEGLEIK